jgi:hypothetical protein
VFGAGRVVHRWYYSALFLLSLVGLWVTRASWRTVGLVVIVQFIMAFNYILFHPATRYRAPTDPLLFAFSAAAVLWLLTARLVRRRPGGLWMVTPESRRGA